MGCQSFDCLGSFPAHCLRLHFPVGGSELGFEPRESLRFFVRKVGLLGRVGDDV